MREYHYTVDRDGRIFHDGTEIVDPAVLRFFLLAMRQTPDDRYMVPCQGEENWFSAPDTPFVVQRVRPVPDSGATRSLELVFAGDYREILDPSTLHAVSDQLCCRVRRGAFRARFGRVALQQLAGHLVEGDHGLALLLDGSEYLISQP